MKFLGIDLAWTQSNESGLIVLERDGTISDAGWTVGTAETLSWITARADDDTLIFVDAPLIVTNPAGTQRLCENHTSKRYGRWKAGANSTNLGKPARLAGVSDARQTGAGAERPTLASTWWLARPRARLRNGLIVRC